MKIIISPSKTKKINNLPIKDSGSLTQKEPFYLEITNEIIEKIKNLFCRRNWEKGLEY